jgi:hypothetical protein
MNLTTIKICLENYKDLLLVTHFLKKQILLNWQIFLETNIPIVSPFYYQIHFLLQKINKRGKQQNRMLVITNKVIKFLHSFY